MRLLVLAMLLIAGLAAAQSGYEEIMETSCWGCHAPGRDDRPMDPAFAIDPGFTVLDGAAVMEPRLVNTWYAELSAMSLEVDLSDAPGLSFTGGRGPYHANTTGSLSVDRSEATFALQRHSTELAILIPAGASALRLQLIPDDASDRGPDLTMRLTDAVSDRAFTEIDEAGPGGIERLLMTDPGTIASHGAGNWTVEVALQPVRETRIDPHLEAGFTVAVDAWFNTSLARVQVLDAAGPVLPGNSQPFDVPLVADAAQPGESVTFTARLKLFYEHGDATEDEAWVVVSQTFTVGQEDGAPVLGSQALVVPRSPDVLALDSVAEAIGYAAAFLMLASILSGGILGKGSRRALNQVFGTARRRVAFHNFLSYGILAAAFAHLILFLVEVEWHWAWGLLWGGLGILSLFALGFTGALQVPIIRRWGFAPWRWIHFGMAIAAIVFTVVHILLDGSHFDVRDTIGWQDPLVPGARQ